MNNQESFNLDFCQTLELHITRLLYGVDGELEKGFWCDGVLMVNEIHLLKKKINDTRRIETKAWVGKQGESLFKLILYLGKYSLRRYAKGLKLNDCLPTEANGFFQIDIRNKQMELYLK